MCEFQRIVVCSQKKLMFCEYYAITEQISMVLVHFIAKMLNLFIYILYIRMECVSCKFFY